MKKLTYTLLAFILLCTSCTPPDVTSPAPAETSTPTAVFTSTPIVTPTEAPTAMPTSTPKPTPTAKPTATPSPTPTAKPTATPSPTPTAKPTATPTPTPTRHVCNFISVYDGTQHWRECKGCNKRVEVTGHTFDDGCDTLCNGCGYTRAVTHSPGGAIKYDGTYHWQTCTVCGGDVKKAHELNGAACSVCSFSSAEPSSKLDSISGNVKATATKIGSVGAKGDYTVAQGACTDGKYLYLILENQKAGTEVDHNCKIVKYDIQNGTEVKTSGALWLDHGNDMAYISTTNELVVCHNSPNKTYLTFVDADTLKVKRTVTENKWKMHAIGYNIYTNRFVVGISGSANNYGILNSDLGAVVKLTGHDTDNTKQGLDCDSKYVYFIQYNDNVITVHDWEGNYKQTITVTGVSDEPEALLHIGKQFYLVSYAKQGRGANIYKLKLSN